jgi:hypothetical protein
MAVFAGSKFRLNRRGNQELPAVMREFDQGVSNTSKGSYVFEF